MNLEKNFLQGIILLPNINLIFQILVSIQTLTCRISVHSRDLVINFLSMTVCCYYWKIGRGIGLNCWHYFVSKILGGRGFHFMTDPHTDVVNWYITGIFNGNIVIIIICFILSILLSITQYYAIINYLIQ